jgi:hypothetical protein
MGRKAQSHVRVREQATKLTAQSVAAKAVDVPSFRHVVLQCGMKNPCNRENLRHVYQSVILTLSVGWRATEDDTLRKEPFMELQMRLNVLAVLLSLGFLAAIVFGMV